ncbi:MAG TPA: OB-fold domain-containing protein [Acidimicrobiales bacterium]|nr:OB-fold domain-containing protein [Acidimicrobiales bacterium]
MRAPEIDRDSAPWWDGLRAHRVVVQECRVCTRRWLPRTPACPYCGAGSPKDEPISGVGVVYSFVRAHRAMSEAMAGEVPYTIAAVDLDGGGRIFARVEGDCAIGMRVAPEFVDHETWTELRYSESP